MRRPSPAILGSIAVHGAVVALALVSWTEARDLPKRTIASVPVSIISEVEIAAAAADNPSEELVTEDAATAPIPQPEDVPPVPEPEPTPPPPAPRPVERTPTPRPAPTPPRPTPPPPPKTRPTPTPPRPTPPRPAPRNEAPALDLDALAGERRPSANTGTRAATGQRGQGQASRAQGQSINFAAEVYPNWVLNCDIEGANQLRIQMDITISSTGRITAGPTLVSPRSDPVWRAAADNAVRALRQSAPFNVPEGFEGGEFRPTFNTEQACRNR